MSCLVVSYPGVPLRPPSWNLSNYALQKLHTVLLSVSIRRNKLVPGKLHEYEYFGRGIYVIYVVGMRGGLYERLNIDCSTLWSVRCHLIPYASRVSYCLLLYLVFSTAGIIVLFCLFI